MPQEQKLVGGIFRREIFPDYEDATENRCTVSRQGVSMTFVRRPNGKVEEDRPFRSADRDFSYDVAPSVWKAMLDVAQEVMDQKRAEAAQARPTKGMPYRIPELGEEE